jgi:glucose dehydrogenase
VSLDAATGKERWKVRLADSKLDYTSTVAPVIIGNHVVAGIGGDHLDNPGFIQSYDPENGKLQWKWWTTPRKGEPGIETWPDEYASAHGTGQAWIPGTYDPELNLYIVGTGNPNPVMAEKSRTCAACLQTQEKLAKDAMNAPCTMNCAYGLCETAVPVKLGAQTIGFLQTGQVCAPKSTCQMCGTFFSGSQDLDVLLQTAFVMIPALAAPPLS